MNTGQVERGTERGMFQAWIWATPGIVKDQHSWSGPVGGRVVGNEDMEEGLIDFPSYGKELGGFKCI